MPNPPRHFPDPPMHRQPPGLMFLLLRPLAFWIALVTIHAERLRDGSFEGPPDGGNKPAPKSSMTYSPTGLAWNFSRGAGIQLAAERDVHFYVPGNRAPDGVWIAFLQGEKARISQRFPIPTAGPHRIQYFVAGRDQDPPFGGDTQYEIRANGRRIAFEATYSHQPWTRRFADFTAVAGTNLLEFIVVSPRQNAAAHLAGAALMLDAVSLESPQASLTTASRPPNSSPPTFSTPSDRGQAGDSDTSLAVSGAPPSIPTAVTEPSRPLRDHEPPSPPGKTRARIPWVWILLVLAVGLLLGLMPRLWVALKRSDT